MVDLHPRILEQEAKAAKPPSLASVVEGSFPAAASPVHIEPRVGQQAGDDRVVPVIGGTVETGPVTVKVNIEVRIVPKNLSDSLHVSEGAGTAEFVLLHYPQTQTKEICQGNLQPASYSSIHDTLT